MIYIWLLISAAIEGIADAFVKRWSVDGLWRNAAFALIAYNFVQVAWMAAMHLSKKLAVTGTLWVLFMEVGVLIVGAGFFHETLTVNQIIGCALGIVAIMFLI